MINTSGFLSVIDHGITLHWEDGPTLHRMQAQVRYRTSAESDAPEALLRVGASQRCAGWDVDAEGAQCFMAANADVSARWLWRELDAGWAARLTVRNVSGEDIFIEGLDIILIDAQRNGLFRLGATPDMWQIHSQSDEMLVQPEDASHQHHPVIMFRALPALDASNANPTPMAIKLLIHDDRFAKFDVIADLAGAALAPQAELQSCAVWVVAGDDVHELQQLQIQIDN